MKHTNIRNILIAFVVMGIIIFIYGFSRLKIIENPLIGFSIIFITLVLVLFIGKKIK